MKQSREITMRPLKLPLRIKFVKRSQEMKRSREIATRPLKLPLRIKFVKRSREIVRWLLKTIKTITGNCHEATKIAPPNQVCDKIRRNEKITGNCHEATKIAPLNQVHEKITGNCKEASDIGTSCHIRHKGVRRSPRVKGIRMKIDDPDYRASDDSNDSNNDDTNYIPEDDSSIVANDSSEDTPSCTNHNTVGSVQS